VGAALYGGYWVAEQTFFEEVVDVAHPGDMAVVVDGRLEHHPWDRLLQVARPIAHVPRIVHNEWLRADLAAGITLESGGSGAVWAIQKGCVAGLLGLEVLTLFGAAVVGGLAVAGVDPGPRGRAVVTALLYGVTVAVPVVNLGLLAMQAGLGGSGGDLWAALPRDLGFLAVGLGADQCGRLLVRG
jgi:hypothetical protein